MSTGTAWDLHEIEPTNLIALLPGEHAPTMEAIGEAFRRGAGDPEGVQWEPFEREPYMEWAAKLQFPGAPPMGVWGQAAEPLEAGELGDAMAESCRWAIGCCTTMDEHDPLTQFIDLMKLIGRGLPDVAAVLDLNCGRWYVGDERRLFEDPQVEAPADLMWVIQAASDPEAGDSSPCWIHTKGLWRCGRPELEMLQVPEALAPAAANLLNALAALLVDQGTPSPYTPLSVGDPLTVQLVPWEAAVATLDPTSPGSLASRKALLGDAHGSARAVVCAVDDAGGLTYPSQALEAIECGDAVLEQTARETDRQSAQARAGWPLLRRAAAAAAGDDAVEVLVKSAWTGRATEGKAADREHLWCVVSAVDEDGADGILIDTPRFIDGLESGTAQRIDRSSVSGWQVITADEMFDQDTTQALEQWLDHRTAGAAAR